MLFAICYLLFAFCSLLFALLSEVRRLAGVPGGQRHHLPAAAGELAVGVRTVSRGLRPKATMLASDRGGCLRQRSLTSLMQAARIAIQPGKFPFHLYFYIGVTPYIWANCLDFTKYYCCAHLPLISCKFLSTIHMRLFFYGRALAFSKISSRFFIILSYSASHSLFFLE